MQLVEKPKFAIGERVKLHNSDEHSGTVTNVLYNEILREKGYSGWIYDFDPQDGRRPYIGHRQENIKPQHTKRGG